MAEVFGIAAGAAGIAPVVLELANSVRKLKDYCQNVHSAPQDIQRFVDEVHQIDTIIQQFKSLHILVSDDVEFLQLSLSHCASASTRISSVVSQVQIDMNTHHRRTRMLFPLKREKLKHLTDELERTKSSLNLACNVCFFKTQAQMQQQLQEILSRHPSQICSSRGRVQDLLGGNVQIVKSLPIVQRDPSIAATVWSFVASRCWDILAFQSIMGWKRSLRTHQVLDWYALPFQLCRKGDLLGLQRMLCMRQVSLNDQTVHGETLFITAVIFKQMHVARELCQMGADSTSKDGFDESPLTCFWSSLCAYGFQTPSEIEQKGRDLHFLIDECGIEDDSPLIAPGIKILLKPAAVWTSDDQFQLISQFNANWRLQLHTLKAIVDFRQSDDSVWHKHDEYGLGVMHILARTCGRTWGHSSDEREEWLPLLKMAINARANLHMPAAIAETLPAATPMQMFLFILLTHRRLCLYSLEFLADGLQSWVSALQAVGVDLLRYGQKETSLWVRGVAYFPRPRVVGIEYGAAVQDWKVLTEHPGDRYAGVFWDSVENGPPMPGSWMEPTMKMWEDSYFEKSKHIRTSAKAERRLAHFEHVGR